MDGISKPRDKAEFLVEVRRKFERAAERESANRIRALDDIRFARLGEQWPERIRKDREDDGRPCLVINRLPSFIRQVVNAARQNRPAITVVPADSGADRETAEIMSGLIRNIEVASDADIAYDSAVEGAVSGGFGYIRINTAYTSDDSFDQDIVIERVADPFTVYGDPASESADGSDWNCAFVVKLLTREEFARKYKGAEPVDWDALGYTGLAAPWADGDSVMVAEYWQREEVAGEIVALSDGSVVAGEDYAERAEEYRSLGVVPVYNLTAGKYDLVVKAGPFYGTQREHAQVEIVELVRAAPQTGPALIPMYLENSDWPGPARAAGRLAAMTQGGGNDQARAQLQQAGRQIEQLQLENRELKAQFALKARELAIKEKEADTKAAELIVRQREAQAWNSGSTLV